MTSDQIWPAVFGAFGGMAAISAILMLAARAKFSDFLRTNDLYKEFKKDTEKDIDDLQKEVKAIRGSWMEMATQGLNELANRINAMQSDLHKELHENSMKYSDQLSEIKSQLATIIGRLEADRDRR